MRALVIGGGQLGRAMQRALAGTTSIVTGVPWTEPAAARSILRSAVHRHILSSAEADEPWMICWTAGAGIVGADQAALAVERSYLTTTLDALVERPDSLALGRLFLASSAGGVYAGDGSSITTERSTPSPTSDYGASKLAQDEICSAWADQTGVPALIGRISNLYGPDQNMAKPQGFISHLCRAMAKRESFVLSVPSHTIRDFVYTDDVAARVARWALAPAAAGAQTKVIAAERSVTLGRVIGLVQQVTGARSRVTFASNAATHLQPKSLRFRSVVMREMDRCTAHTLEDGIARTWAATRQRRNEARFIPQAAG